MPYCEKTIRALKARLGTASPLPREIWEHLRVCSACRTVYDRTFGLERILTSRGNNSVLPSPLELQRSGAFVLENLEKISQAERCLATVKHWLAHKKMTLVPAFAATMALVVMGSFYRRTVDRTPEWAARGSQDSSFAIRSFCQTKDGTVYSLSDQPAPQEASTCPEDGRVLFAYLSDEAGWLYALTMESNQSMRWLLPGPGENNPRLLEKSEKLIPLEITLTSPPGEAHTPRLSRKVEILFIRTNTPLPKELIETSLKNESDLAVLQSTLGARICESKVEFDSVFIDTFP